MTTTQDLWKYDGSVAPAIKSITPEGATLLYAFADSHAKSLAGYVASVRQSVNATDIGRCRSVIENGSNAKPTAAFRKLEHSDNYFAPALRPTCRSSEARLQSNRARYAAIPGSSRSLNRWNRRTRYAGYARNTSTQLVDSTRVTY